MLSIKRFFPCFFLVVALPLSAYVYAGSWSEETIADMPVSLYVPGTEPVLAGKRALMISTGGCGQQKKGNTEFRDQSNWEATAKRYGMIVAVPNAPEGGVFIFGCWDYYKDNHTRTNRHNDNILALVEELKSRDALNIDTNQVYFSGLSSGGGMSNVLSCLAPDVFAGVGNVAGPALGSAATEIQSVSLSKEEVKNTCIALAGDKQEALASQIFSVAWGEKDKIVTPKYAELIVEGMSLVYRAQKDAKNTTINGDKHNAKRETWSDKNGPRISRLMVEGIGHAWPAGAGSGESKYMDNTSIDYPAQLTKFLFENNRRVDRAYKN